MPDHRQVGRADVCQPQRFSDCARDQTGIVDRSQRDEHDARRALVRECACELQRQPALADASGADERDETRGRIGQPFAQTTDVVFSADELSWGNWECHAPELVYRRVGGRGAGARHECVADLGCQVEGRSERADGFDVGPAPFPPFERADRVHREAGDGRQFLLGKPCGLTQRLEVRAKRPRGRKCHQPCILPPGVRALYEHC